MSGVLHPTGPEPARTYWVRRGVLLAVILLLAVGVVLAVANLTKAAVATAPPPPLPAGNPAASPTPTASGASTPASAAPTPGPSTSRASSPAPSTPVSSPPAAASPSASASAQPGPSATVVGTPDCRPAELQVKLAGDRRLSVGENTTFTVSLVNAGRLTCLTSVTAANFELKVYSGKDRIWSSRDCAKTLAPFDKKLAAKGVVAWKMTWDGERSVAGTSCRRGTDKLRGGTYWATAQLKGADPVQVRMIIG